MASSSLSSSRRASSIGLMSDYKHRKIVRQLQASSETARIAELRNSLYIAPALSPSLFRIPLCRVPTSERRENPLSHLSLQFFNSRIEHEHHQVNEKRGLITDDVIGFATHVNKVLKSTSSFISPIDDVSHVGGQDERYPVTIDRTKLLVIV